MSYSTLQVIAVKANPNIDCSFDGYYSKKKPYKRPDLSFANLSKRGTEIVVESQTWTDGINSNTILRGRVNTVFNGTKRSLMIPFSTFGKLRNECKYYIKECEITKNKIMTIL